MPTSTNVTNLKINELTEAQFDSAVSGGVIGANEISILTDMDEAIQVDTMPTASADELGKVYQFIGTTDANYTHGYFYECVSDGATPAVYSWSRVDVQPGGLVNTATGTSSLSLIGSASSQNYSVNIGYNTSVSNANGLAIGSGAVSMGNGGIAIGRGAAQTSATGNSQIAIGYNAKTAGGVNSVQIGQGTNSTANTVCFGNANGNFEMMSADGTIPHARLVNAVSSTSVSIATTDWSSNTASVTVSGLTATSVVWVAPDNASQSAYTTAGVYASSQSADPLTFTCTQTPTASLTINVVFC